MDEVSTAERSSSGRKYSSRRKNKIFKFRKECMSMKLLVRVNMGDEVS